jgi:hypothetical protein
MRFRCLIVSLLGLLAGCQTHSPMGLLKPRVADINNSRARTQLGNAGTFQPRPLPLEPMTVRPSSAPNPTP